ncbi:MAG TPA: hemolysin family protein [Rhizomicrobium sp.]|jgi:CBS domain containing-hemolysin-like protein|nr:hemolysin family protein [Rhizomicrobium sp.]
MSDQNRKDHPATGNGRSASLLQRLSHLLRRGHEMHAIRESLEEVIEESDRQSAELSPQERIMLANLLKFGELRVGDVMVPRADIVAVEENTSLKELVTGVREGQHSRLPVYRETLDDPIGLVHIKDVLSLVEIAEDGGMRLPDVSIAQIRRNLLFVPASMPALDLMLKMQTTHMHLALVIDEYGGTDGLVSIEDLVEEIVGDIDDEHDVAEPPQLKALPDGGYEADARLDLDDFREQTGFDIEPEGEDEDVDTLGGFVVSLLGRVPERGEIIPHMSGLEFEVLEADPRRVKRLRLRKSQPAPDLHPERET